MKYRAYPLGNPTVLTREQLLTSKTDRRREEEQRDSSSSICPPLPWTEPEQNPFQGFLLCRVCPPLPAMLRARKALLPMRTQAARLVFTLCAQCAERCRSTPPCRHTAAQRSWIAAYSHFELNKALEIGYTVTDLFEVLPLFFAVFYLVGE